MACEVAYYYPDENTPSASFAPATAPLVSGSEQEVRRNVLAEVMGDGFTQHTTRTGASVRIYTHAFAGLSATEKAAYDSFIEAVQGNPFRMTDPTTSGYVTVKIDQGGFSDRWAPSEANAGAVTWQTTLVLRAA